LYQFSFRWLKKHNKAGSHLPLFRPCIADPEENARIFDGLCGTNRIPARPVRFCARGCPPGATTHSITHFLKKVYYYFSCRCDRKNESLFLRKK
jgi:hypothetical protein